MCSDSAEIEGMLIIVSQCYDRVWEKMPRKLWSVTNGETRMSKRDWNFLSSRSVILIQKCHAIKISYV